MKLLFQDEYDENKFIEETDDYIIARGGDGTLLRAINKFRHLNKPFFGIAKGTSNFLMNEVPFLNKPEIVKFDLINVKVTYNNLERDLSSIDDHYVERTKEYQAFNDVSIGGTMNSWIEFEIKERKDRINPFKGGGIIVSTPQGSTGINKNNGGVIMPLDSKHWSITGDKCNRRISTIMKPRKTEIFVKSRTPVSVWVDGSNHVIENVSKVVLTKGDSVEVVFNGLQEFINKRKI